MSRPPRMFKPGSFELEGRLLLSAAHASLTPLEHDTVGFAGPGSEGMPQVVLQQDGTATIHLVRSAFVRGGVSQAPIQVVVATDPSSSAVGVNVGAVHQTVTFSGLNPDASVTIPILAGAPNPGEVDVPVTITPINPPPNLTVAGPLDLRVLASSDLLRPSIVSAQGTPGGIVLTFSKAMDPAGASNVKNYVATSTSSTGGGSGGGWYSFANFFSSILGNHSSHSSPPPVRFQSAQYDAATHTVTLVTRRPLRYNANLYTVRLTHQATASGGKAAHSSRGPGLTDLRGQPIETTGGVVVSGPA